MTPEIIKTMDTEKQKKAQPTMTTKTDDQKQCMVCAYKYDLSRLTRVGTYMDQPVYMCGPCYESTRNKNDQVVGWGAAQHGKDLEKEVEDIVKQPKHYAQFKIEPITFIMVNKLPFHVGNIIKYACRAGHKRYPNQNSRQSEITDLKKAMRYCEMRISQLERDDLDGKISEMNRIIL